MHRSCARLLSAWVRRAGRVVRSNCSSGFFFDGTRNNKFIAEASESQTNVARLFEIFNDEVDPSYSARRHRFRTYVEGVGTPCFDKVGDPGVGIHAQAGAASGWGGEARINWALLEFQNHLHRYFTGRTLTEALGDKSPDVVRAMSEDLSYSELQVTNLARSANLSLADYSQLEPGGQADAMMRKTLNSAMSLLRLFRLNYFVTPNDGGRRSVLARRNTKLRELLQGPLKGKPGVERIRVSVFGFSRGAAQARVFVNWLKDACDPPQGFALFRPRGDGVLRLGGIEVQIDFMGLFDTVASSGVAQGLHEAWTGHGAWARKEDMEIPSRVSRCVHMVAAHEVRGSFPVDLIDGNGYEEIVYPGVHSDLGGGYKPQEQGRSSEDADKLSQIPLCDMYREAVKAGVPLRLAGVNPIYQASFRVSDAPRLAFNEYVEATRAISTGQASTTKLIRQHYEQYLCWRRLRAEKGPEWLGNTQSAQAASPQDYEDLIQANEELLKEVKALTEDNAVQNLRDRPLLPVVTAKDMYTGAMLLWRRRKEEMWLDEIEAIWNGSVRPPTAVIKLLDDYVHDSRAWFKPLGKDDDVWLLLQHERMKLLEARQDLSDTFYARGRADIGWSLSLNEGEKADLVRYREDPKALALQSSGREFYMQWGYLRWRSTYENPQVRDQKEAQTDMEETIRTMQNIPINWNSFPRF